MTYDASHLTCWQSTKNGNLPEPDTEVLIYIINDGIYFAFLDEEMQWHVSIGLKYVMLENPVVVKAWMVIPELTEDLVYGH